MSNAQIVVGQKAIDMIVELEDGSKEQYIKEYQHPVWPGGISGVTWGIGYDGGQHTADQIQSDWGRLLDTTTVQRLVSCAGIRSQAAHQKMLEVHSVTVPWEAAYEVFSTKTLPRFAEEVWAILPNCRLLNPDAFGALVSLAYNRGYGGFEDDDSDRTAEMSDIRYAMSDQDFGSIPESIRSMKRLWPSNQGLRARRDREAQLFEEAQNVAAC